MEEEDKKRSVRSAYKFIAETMKAEDYKKFAMIMQRDYGKNIADFIYLVQNCDKLCVLECWGIMR